MTRRRCAVVVTVMLCALQLVACSAQPTEPVHVTSDLVVADPSATKAPVAQTTQPTPASTPVPKDTPQPVVEVELPALPIEIVRLDQLEPVGNQEDGLEGVENPFFFSDGTSERTYSCNYAGWEDYEDAVVQCRITDYGAYVDGRLYGISFIDLPVIKIPGFEEIYTIDGRITLEYFYVTEEQIYKFQTEPRKLHMFPPDQTEVTDSILVCQDEPIADQLREDEKGWHYFISADNDVREYHLYSNVVETGYYERLIWEKGKGMTVYLSGYGAGRDHIELTWMAE